MSKLALACTRSRKKEEIKALILTNDNIIQKLFRSSFQMLFRAAFSKISSLYYLRLSGNVLIGLLGGHSCGTFQTNPIINRRFITRESSSKAVKAVNCYSYHLLKVDPSGSVTRVIEAECRQRAENKKPNRRRPTNERSSFDTEAFFFFLQNWMLMIRPFFAKTHSSIPTFFSFLKRIKIREIRVLNFLSKICQIEGSGDLHC